MRIKKLKSAAFVLCLAFCAADPAIDDDDRFAWLSQFTHTIMLDDISYEVVLDSRRLAIAPVWHDDEPNPPLAVRDAIRAAHDALHKDAWAEIVADPEGWRVRTVALYSAQRNDDRLLWYYRILFEQPEPELPPNRGFKTVVMFVSFDGRVIDPTGIERRDNE